MQPYYSHAGVTIYHGDSREVLPTIGVGYVFLTDPVYGINGGSGGDARDFGKGNYQRNGWEDTEEYVKTVCVSIVKECLRGAVRGALTPGIRCLSFYPQPSDIGCFWTPAAATHGPWGFVTFNPILFYGRDFRAGKGAWPTGKTVTESAVKNGHPCAKPEGAWRWLCSKVAQPGETVVDPFMGSGTTLRVAKDIGCTAIGIEIEERYCEIAAKRLEQEVMTFGKPETTSVSKQVDMWSRDSSEVPVK